MVKVIGEGGKSCRFEAAWDQAGVRQGGGQAHFVCVPCAAPWVGRCGVVQEGGGEGGGQQAAGKCLERVAERWDLPIWRARVGGGGASCGVFGPRPCVSGVAILLWAVLKEGSISVGLGGCGL